MQGKGWINVSPLWSLLCGTYINCIITIISELAHVSTLLNFSSKLVEQL